MALGPADVRVDARDEGPDDLLAVRVIVRQRISSGPEQPRRNVPIEGFAPRDLGQGARGLSPPQLELEQPVARGIPSLGEEEVLLRRRIDVRYAPAVGEDLDRLRQAG